MSTKSTHITEVAHRVSADRESWPRPSAREKIERADTHQMFVNIGRWQLATSTIHYEQANAEVRFGIE